MTNIDTLSLETVVGGKAAAPATTTTATSTGSKLKQLGSDAISGCLSGVGSAKATTGKAPNIGQLGLSCVTGAGQSFLKGLGSLFGGSSSK